MLLNRTSSRHTGREGELVGFFVNRTEVAAKLASLVVDFISRVGGTTMRGKEKLSAEK